jgi:RhoGEF domain
VCRRLPINNFMQAPNRKVQRLGVLFEGIIKNTEETNRDRETLQRALDELKDIAHECDARQVWSPTWVDGRIGETTANLQRAELETKLVFKTGQKVDLGLQDATRRIIHQGQVSRKSDNKLDWLNVHLILLDNYLIMTKKRTDRGVERLYVSKQVAPPQPPINGSPSQSIYCYWKA